MKRHSATGSDDTLLKGGGVLKAAVEVKPSSAAVQIEIASDHGLAARGTLARQRKSSGGAASFTEKAGSESSTEGALPAAVVTTDAASSLFRAFGI